MNGERASYVETPDTAPHFLPDRSGVAILGCGTIAQSAHLPAYARPE